LIDAIDSGRLGIDAKETDEDDETNSNSLSTTVLLNGRVVLFTSGRDDNDTLSVLLGALDLDHGKSHS
jgi:hypothetical protein